jgi:hypothetical protein
MSDWVTRLARAVATTNDADLRDLHLPDGRAAADPQPVRRGRGRGEARQASESRGQWSIRLLADLRP